MLLAEQARALVLREFNPNHFPAKTPGGKGGQFAPKRLSKAAIKKLVPGSKVSVKRGATFETAEVRGVFKNSDIEANVAGATVRVGAAHVHELMPKAVPKRKKAKAPGKAAPKVAKKEPKAPAKPKQTAPQVPKRWTPASTRGDWGDVQVGDTVTSQGRHGAGQPPVTGPVVRIERDSVIVRTPKGERRRSIRNVKRTQGAKREQPGSADDWVRDQLAIASGVPRAARSKATEPKISKVTRKQRQTDVGRDLALEVRARLALRQGNVDEMEAALKALKRKYPNASRSPRAKGQGKPTGVYHTRSTPTSRSRSPRAKTTPAYTSQPLSGIEREQMTDARAAVAHSDLPKLSAAQRTYDGYGASPTRPAPAAVRDLATWEEAAKKIGKPYDQWGASDFAKATAIYKNKLSRHGAS